MEIIHTELSGLLVFKPKIFGDSRGWFYESWSKKVLEEMNFFCDFVQDNHAFSAAKGTLRGLHFQKPPYAQAKLVRCSRGKILDVAVDIRENSDTYLKYFSIELSSENKLQLFIPRGFAHGYLTLVDDCEVQYKADQYYAPQSEGSIIWNDPTIGIDWKVTSPILSEKDARALPIK